MSNHSTRVVRELVAEEIRRVVADSIKNDDLLRSGHFAALIAKAYPNSGMSVEEIATEIIRAGSSAGVAVEIDRPDDAEAA